jgi:hypothetical protein
MSAPLYKNPFDDDDADLRAYIAVQMAACVDDRLMELARQKRILAGQEHVCVVCGCSESRSCEEGCVWATETHCSRCVNEA